MKLNPYESPTDHHGSENANKPSKLASEARTLIIQIVIALVILSAIFGPMALS